MADFQTAGTDFATGVQSSAAAGETPLSTGSQEIKSFSADVKATCKAEALRLDRAVAVHDESGYGASRPERSRR